MPILVDTGVLYALADRDDDWHARADRLIAESSEVLGALAERLRVKTIATTDRRHFTTIRPRHERAFTLVP